MVERLMILPYTLYTSSSTQIDEACITYSNNFSFINTPPYLLEEA